MSVKKHEIIFDSSKLYNENYAILRDLGNGQKQVLCGCGTTFFTHVYDKKIKCPTCKAENALLDSIELLAKYALKNSAEEDVKPIIMILAGSLAGFDLHSPDEFPNLSKYWEKITKRTKK